MFTGIIEATGKVISIETEGSNYHFEIESKVSPELKIDQSVSHNGICLTVTDVKGNKHKVTAIDETMKRTNLGLIKPGDLLNLERSLNANGRFDGHIVQGHVDQVGTCTNIEESDGSWLVDFNYDPSGENITVEKGSVCINGISLTCFNSGDDFFRVAIIPYTFENTNFQNLKVGDKVNIEFDIIGKYVKKLLQEIKL